MRSEVVLSTNPNKLWSFPTLESLLFCGIVSELTSLFWQLLHFNVIFFPFISLQVGRTPTFEISDSKECVLSLSIPTLHCSDWVKSLPWHPTISVALPSNLPPNARNFHEWKRYFLLLYWKNRYKCRYVVRLFLNSMKLSHTMIIKCSVKEKGIWNTFK